MLAKLTFGALVSFYDSMMVFIASSQNYFSARVHCNEDVSLKTTMYLINLVLICGQQWSSKAHRRKINGSQPNLSNIAALSVAVHI